MEFNPVQDKKVYQQIIDQIKQMIYQGQLKKGDKLPSERTLTAELNVSRSSLREAFSALEIIGLIESRHGEGTFIKENTDDNFLKPLSLLFMVEEDVNGDLIELRKMIETSSVELAAWRADQESLNQIKKHVDLMKDSRGDAVDSRRADRGFHYALAKTTGNKLIYKFLNSISGVIDLYLANAMERIVKDENKNEAFIRQHDKIYQAIKLGDKDLAKEAMVEHLNWSQDLMDI
ncbi:FadR family transcriptional regulator [Natroniella sulfidigena]|uniref:FadR/GntR family transcriptional regulator n=1 Tax=Natroniella sulfidigena TaxID=723921 RepID=UPI00200ADD2A|nr:FadR/GntR family transcriptional regulator [Natroniella sulfidigena]MCK8817013.1 FadR family transcriptional regulator [Natroniella sulfidigena]